MEAAVQFPVARSAGYYVPDWRNDPRTGNARTMMRRIILPLVRPLATPDTVEFAEAVEKELYYQSNSLHDYINTETVLDRIRTTTQKLLEIYCAAAMAKNNSRHAVPSHLSGFRFGTGSFLPQQTLARNPGAASAKSYWQDRSYPFVNSEQPSLATNPAAHLVSPACFLSVNTEFSDPCHPVSLVGSSIGNATFCNPSLSPHCGSVFGARSPPNDRQTSHGPLFNNNLVGGQYSRDRHGKNIAYVLTDTWTDQSGASARKYNQGRSIGVTIHPTPPHLGTYPTENQVLVVGSSHGSISITSCPPYNSLVDGGLAIPRNHKRSGDGLPCRKYSPGIPGGQYRGSQHGDDILHRQDMPLSPDMVQDNYLVFPGGIPCHSSRSKHSPRLPINGTVSGAGIKIQNGNNTHHGPTFGIHSSQHGDDILRRQDMPLGPDMVQDNYLVFPGGTPCHSSRSKHSPRLPINGTVSGAGINIQNGKNTHRGPTFGIHSSQHGDDILRRQDMPLGPDMVQDNYLVFPGGTPCHSSRSKHSPRLPINGTVSGAGINIQNGKNTHRGPTFGIHSSESAARRPHSTEQSAAVPARQYTRGLSGEHIVQDRDANPTSEPIVSVENPISHAGASHGNRSGFSNGHSPFVGTDSKGEFSLENGTEAVDGLSSRNGPIFSEGTVPWPIHSAEQFPEDLQEVVHNSPDSEPVWNALPALEELIVGTSEFSDLLKWNEWANESIPRSQHSSESLLPDVPMFGEPAVINLTDNDEPQLNLEVGPAHVQEIPSFSTVDDSKSDPSPLEPLNCHELKVPEEEQLMDEDEVMRNDYLVADTGTEIPSEDENTRVQLPQSEEMPEDEILEKGNIGCKSSKTESSDQCYVSMTEYLSEEQILEHLSSLGNSIRTGSGDEATTSFSENICRLCGEEKLFYEVVPCSYCGANIKKNEVYYSLSDTEGGSDAEGGSDTEGGLTLCKQCYNRCGKKINCGEKSYSKGKLRRKSSKRGTEEDWVQCDKCQGWQHQICTLYNQVADSGGNAKYTCPLCCLKEIHSGNRLPSEVRVLSACNLPRTALSDHIEQRLQTRLREDRELRAKGLGKGFLEVPGAEGLTIRVVHTEKRELQVKDEFLDLFNPNDYPSQFPYTSKMILLFQKIGGVDVIVFGFYTEEYGSNCGDPNSRCVYISYLDSIKYFRPSISSATGDALRTFAYHEILIGYLEYCKKRGFVSCHLWSCPPQKGQDYLFYNHPEDQRTLTSPKLRNWYQTMIQKAIKEKVVVCSSNVYDCHFRASCSSRYPVSATRLPFFEGDSWFNLAGNVLREVNEESKSDYQRKRVKTGKHQAKAVQCTDSLYDSKDFLFMQKLGRILQQDKKDFIVMHLRHVCSYCHHPISTGHGWFCGGCTDLWLCERCHDEENSVADSHRSSKGKRHSFSKVAVDILPTSTDDSDGPIENLMLRDRHRFLRFCQKKHYQFATLRRAKHSSMMVLHFLSHPDDLSECSICANISLSTDLLTCETCPDLRVCPPCQVQRGSSRGHRVAYRI